MSDVFISYPADAQRDASNLAATLEERGLSAWIAAKDLPNDTPDWKSQIEEALESAVAIVFLVYPNREPSAWVQSEYMHALESYWSGKTKILVPVLVGENAQPPSFLQQWQSLKVQTRSDWDRAASQLARWIEEDHQVRNTPTKKEKEALNRRLNEIADVAKRWRSNSTNRLATGVSSPGDKAVFRSSRTGEIRHRGQKKSRISENKK